MKLRPVLLALSLVTNAALVAAFALRPAATTALFRDAFAGSPPPVVARPAARSPASPPPKPPEIPAADEAPFTWSAGDSGDFHGLVARLRAAGFPPAMVRAVVQAALNEHFSARRRELMRGNMPTEYWKNPREDRVLNTQRQTAMREFSREHQKLMRDVLGSDVNRDEDWTRRQFGDIAQVKVDHYQKIMTDYNELTQKVHEDSQGIMLPEDRAKLALLEKERRADIERLFSPDELLEFDLRNSQSSNTVRNRLGRFEVSEDEFRALFAAQKAYDDQNPRLDRPEPGMAQQRQQAVDEVFQTVLGAERYAEFKKANAPQGQQMGPNEDFVARLVTRLDLPPATTATVMSVQQDVQQRANAVRTDRSLTPAQRSAQLAALANEATAKLTPALGARGLEAYKTNGGQWLNTLTRQPAARGGPVPVD